jgi:hypothetical protein
MRGALEIKATSRRGFGSEMELKRRSSHRGPTRPRGRGGYREQQARKENRGRS